MHTAQIVDQRHDQPIPLGENGAGKTTLMRVLTTVLKQTEGMVSLDGILYNEGNYEKIQKKIVIFHRKSTYTRILR